MVIYGLGNHDGEGLGSVLQGATALQPAQKGGNTVSREIDRRDFSANKATAARKAELRSLASEASGHLPEAHRIMIESFDATTGNPTGLRAAARAPGRHPRAIPVATRRLR